MSNNKITSKQIAPILQFGGLGLLVYGWSQGQVVAGVVGILAALVGGVMWKMKRQDAEHEAQTRR